MNDWMKIGTANKETWSIWRRVDQDEKVFFTVEVAPLIPLHKLGRQSLETLLAMKGLIQDA